MYNIEVHDNIVDPRLQEQVWEYLQKQSWHMAWPKVEKELIHYTPKEGYENWFSSQGYRRHSSIHRCCLASDYESLKPHLPIYMLWKEINRKLGNAYALTGAWEGMKDTETPVPPTQDPNLETGWRIYANAIHNSHVMAGGFIHRDNHDLEDETSVSMLYVVNKEWYPSWGADVRFYPDDPEGTTGDHQQFNVGFQQQRDFNIGWLDQGRIVSHVPGRLMIYDSRNLHATSPARFSDLNNPSIKVAFRARRL